MKQVFKFSVIVLSIGLIACNKENPDDTSKLPEGATPYTETDIQFVPYQSGNRVFKKMPLLDSTLTFQFKERLRTEEYFAWDQTFFTYSTDAELEIEFRLRYLQTDNDVSEKTLAMYIPYRDANNVVQSNVFEIPISTVGLENGFFQNLVEYHDTITLNAIDWYNVYEVTPLVSTDPDEDGPQNYSRAYYNSTYGLIQMNQENGTVWILQQ